MADQTFSKVLTANDTGQSGGHQAGIHVPRSQGDLIAFLPPLDPATKNPDAWLDCEDETGQSWRFRYIYYNNCLHDPGGTRDEYRITHMTAFMRATGAQPGDVLTISGEPRTGFLRLIVRKGEGQGSAESGPRRVRLKGWHRVY